MSINNYDVIIVGAGPAGAFLAHKLKNQKISVLILEKDKFPRYKVCASGLTKKAYDILYRENKNIKKIVEKKTDKTLYIRNDKLTRIRYEKELIYMTYRSSLDSFLVNMAVDNKNIFFIDKIKILDINKKEKTVKYKIKNKEKEVKFKVLVGAWGTNIKLNSLVNIKPFERFSVSSSWEGPTVSKFKDYFDGYSMCQILKNYPGFVAYIFPKSEKITAGLFTSIIPVKLDLKKMWNEFVIFWNLDSKITPNYALIPVRDFKKPIAKENILLIGDAAGIADPFTGEGIYYALVSSEVASKNIIKYFKNKNYDLAKFYNRDIDIKLGRIHKWAKIYENFFHHFPNFCFWLGSEFYIGNKIVNRFITGEIKYNEILKIFKLAIGSFFNGEIFRKN